MDVCISGCCLTCTGPCLYGIFSGCLVGCRMIGEKPYKWIIFIFLIMLVIYL